MQTVALVYHFTHIIVDDAGEDERTHRRFFRGLVDDGHHFFRFIHGVDKRVHAAAKFNVAELVKQCLPHAF